MKQTLILGNIVTMDEKRPFAKAVLAKDGVFVFIGSVEDAKKLADADAEVLITEKTSFIRDFWNPIPTAIWPATA